jgi:hypothetical protein
MAYLKELAGFNGNRHGSIGFHIEVARKRKSRATL